MILTPTEHEAPRESIVGAWRPNDHREILSKLALSAPRFSTVGDVP